MGFFKKRKQTKEQPKNKGGYIFLSHARADIEKVRKLRNGLENHGFDPLCFYLKCLNDDSEIEDLIKREIDAREWFVYANSKNARKSNWVRLERQYIERTNHKKIIEVEIDDESAVQEVIEKISRNLHVFISYARKDYALAERICRKLEEKDYIVFFEVTTLGNTLGNMGDYAVVEAAKQGCVLALITPDYVKLNWVLHELSLAAGEGGEIIPVIIGDTKPTEELLDIIGAKQMYTLPEKPTDREIDLMIEKISQSVLGRF